MNKRENIDEDLVVLARAYVTKARQTGQRIDMLWQKIGVTGGAVKYLNQMILCCHNFAGSAGSYGLTDIARLSTELEQQIKALRDAEPSRLGAGIRRTSGLVKELVRLANQVGPDSLDSLATSVQAESLRAGRERLIFIADNDPEQAGQLALLLSAHGFKPQVFTELTELRVAVMSRAPDALVIDTVFPEGDLAGIETVAALQKTERKSLPVVFISSRNDAEARLQALRAGGSGYFTKPVALPALAAKLHQLTRAVNNAPYRVMVVDDDVTTCKMHAAVLRKSGFEVSSINNPMDIIQTAMDFRPELIFLDLYMPQADGLEVATMLRQEERFLDVPIVFLSGENDEAIKERALKGGASSFLNKPVSKAHLVAVANAHTYQYRSRAEKNRYLERIDPDTGLYSRDFLLSKLDLYCRKGKSRGTTVAALLMLEIDQYGYLFRTLGEERVKLICACIAKSIRSVLGANDIAGSHTNSSFLILSVQPDLNDLEDFAGRLHQAVAGQPLNILGQEYPVAVSIGISKASKNNQNQILSEAALACSQARKEGGNQVVLHPDLGQEVREDHQLKFLRRQIKDAIKNKRMQLEFSPVVGITVDDEVRYSALMRLQDEKGEILYPAQFIPIAQKYDLLTTLDRWVVMTALRSLAKKQKKHPQTLFFIKLSQATVQDPDFPQWLDRALEKFPIQPQSCVFEIREDDVAGNFDEVKHFVSQIRAANCGFAIDRFGVDMDAFHLLPALGPDYLRLASPLLQGLAAETEKQEVIEQICTQAHDLNCKVLAAYIQNSQALALLWKLGVDYIQGDFLEQPQGVVLELEAIE